MGVLSDLVLIRHGESEYNRAQTMADAGDDRQLRQLSSLTGHDSLLAITDLGRQQSHTVGRWLQERFPGGFDRYYVSPYRRALQTAAYMGLDEATWSVDPRLRDMDYGRGDIACWPGRDAPEFVEATRRRTASPMFGRPVGGETMAEIVERIRSLQSDICDDAAGGTALLVCHGPVIHAFHLLITGITATEYAHWKAEQPITNGHVFHYTSRRVLAGQLAGPLSAWRSAAVCADRPQPETWTAVRRRLFTNAQLLTLGDGDRSRPPMGADGTS